MKITKLVLITLLIMVSGSLFAKTGQAPDPAAVKRGLTVYKTNCQQCHQENGTGEVIPFGIFKPTYIPAMPLDETSHAWHHGDDQIIQTIRRGNQRMPPFDKVLSVQQLRDVVAYIKSLWSPKIIKCQGAKHMFCM